ncbi:MAG TPA: hypothetical protein PKH77_09200 [Anaerolineae bacterium]|nr:hypothetical protein [Anaerolineae bacterium]
MTKTRTDLEKQAKRAIWQYAFMRMESAIVIGGTILLSFFYQSFMPPWWPVWGWPMMGAFALSLLVVSTLTDKQTRVRVQSELLQENFNPRALGDPHLRHEVTKALEYQRSIRSHIARQKSGVLKDRLTDTARQIEDWVGNIHKLAVQLDAYHHDELLMQERNSVPSELETLQSRRSETNNPEVRQQLDEVIASKRKQWDSLKALDERMEQADLQLEQSNTALATVYSQLQLIGAQDSQGGRSERLRQDIQEQVARLNDLVSSINAVYDSQGS